MRLVLIAAVLTLCGIPANGQTIQYPQTAKTGHLSVTIPGDSATREETSDTPIKRTQTFYHVSRSLDANIIVSCIEYKSRDGVQQRPRLTEFLTQFIASYDAVEHMTTIQDDGRKGLSISTEIYHDRSRTRFTYVESRVFVDDSRLYAVTVTMEVTGKQPLNTEAVTEILTSMKVSK